jgi:hypothetical protein
MWQLLVTTLGGIGTPPGDWLTSPAAPIPTVPPLDALPSADSKVLLYVAHSRTEPNREQTTMRRHGWRAWFTVWIIGKDPITTNRARADVLRAIYAAEGAFTAAFGQPMYPDALAHLSSVGCDVAQQDAFLDFDTDHTAT